MVSLNSMMNRVAEKHFLKVTKRKKLTDSRTHSPSDLPHSISHLELMIGSVSVVPLFLLPLRFLLRISNLPVVPPLSRKLTARSCSAASLGDVPLTGQPSSESSATGAFGHNKLKKQPVDECVLRL